MEQERAEHFATGKSHYELLFLSLSPRSSSVRLSRESLFKKPDYFAMYVVPFGQADLQVGDLRRPELLGSALLGP
jgi:hypothetical protein